MSGIERTDKKISPQADLSVAVSGLPAGADSPSRGERDQLPVAQASGGTGYAIAHVIGGRKDPKFL